jgi:hypothetical protein
MRDALGVNVLEPHCQLLGKLSCAPLGEATLHGAPEILPTAAGHLLCDLDEQVAAGAQVHDDAKHLLILEEVDERDAVGVLSNGLEDLNAGGEPGRLCAGPAERTFSSRTRLEPLLLRLSRCRIFTAYSTPVSLCVHLRTSAK